MTSVVASGLSYRSGATSIGLHRRHAAVFWPFSLSLVLAAHLAAAWWLIATHDAPPMAPQPLPAIMLDLAPSPVPPRPPMMQPPAPQPPVPQPVPTMPPLATPQVQAPVIEPLKPLPEVAADVALPPPVKKPVKAAPKPKPVKPKKVETPLPPTPVPVKPQPAPVAAAPVTPPVDTAQQQKEAALAVASLAAKSNWYGEIVQHIAKFKRLPRGRLRAPLRAVISFEISREGKVLSQHLLQSSGRDDIDQEAVAWISRADPMPKAPGEISDADLSHGFTIPVDFTPR